MHPVGFERVLDEDGDVLRPMSFTDNKGRVHTRVALEPLAWGGRTASGLIVSHEGEDLPITLGIVRAILYTCELCISRLPRERGGLMPGDLVAHPRYATARVSTIRTTTEVIEQREGKEERWSYAASRPLVVILDSEIISRVDGVLPDPYEVELQRLRTEELLTMLVR